MDTSVTKKVFEIDGRRFTTLEGFYDEVSRVLTPDHDWGQNLDAFNDSLGGGFGTPEEGFRLVWRNHELSREKLGHAETARQLALRLKRCHPTDRARVAEELAAAENRKGPTVIDWLLDIISGHDDIELVLS